MLILINAQRFFCGLALVLLPLTGLAQTPPHLLPEAEQDAREQLLHQQRQRALQQEMAPRPDVRLPPAETQPGGHIPGHETPCFNISAIHLKAIGTEDFSWALESALLKGDPAIGRCLGAQGINIVMARIQNAIVERGYVTTRVLAGDQNLNQGILTLTVVPGRVRQIRYAASTEGAPDLGRAIPLRPGDLLDLRAIEQGLENLKRVPTADADIQIIPASGNLAAAGQSDLVVKWKQARRWRLSVAADDAGSRSTGKNQGSTTVSLDNLLGLNDLFYASLNHSLAPLNSDGRKTRGYSLYYAVPAGYWQFSTSLSSSDYAQTVAGQSQAYTYRGRSQSLEVRLGRMLWRDAGNKLQASVRGWQRTSASYVDDTEILVQRRRTAGWGTTLNHTAYLGRKVLDLALDYKHGTGALGALAAPEEATGEGTGQMELISFDARLDAPFSVLARPLRYSTAWHQQWNRTPLTAQDRLSIGNRYTVRGFDGELTLMGERGFTWRNELAGAAPWPSAETYIALDYGHVSGFPSATQGGQTLVGSAAGLRGSYRRLSYDVFIGAPLVQPAGFQTADVTTGFSLSWNY